ERIDKSLNDVVAEARFPIRRAEHDAPIALDLAVVGRQPVQIRRHDLRRADSSERRTERRDLESVEIEAIEKALCCHGRGAMASAAKPASITRRRTIGNRWRCSACRA